MSYEAIIFILLWGITDRLREIAVFPGWVSKLGHWFDTFYTPDLPVWWPFRDAYHTFKAIIVYVFVGWIWYHYGWVDAVYTYAAWALGQRLGLYTKQTSNLRR